MNKRVAIIGSGFCGLATAIRLRAAGLDVTTTGEVAAVQLAGTPASAEALAAAAAGMSAPTHRPGRSRAA